MALFPPINDYVTKRPSWTITGMVVSFAANVTYWIVFILKALGDKISFELVAGGFLFLAGLALFVGLYFQKRFKVTKDGIEFLGDSGGGTII